MLAAIYARVSTEKQGERVSLDEQIASAQALAKDQGDTIVAVYTDSNRYRSDSGRMVEPSGKRSDRPGFQQMLSDAGQKWGTLYAWRQDRIARGSKATGIFLEVIESQRVTVKLVKETFAPDVAEIRGLMSGMELRAMRSRTMMGIEGRIKNGLHAGNVPGGYDRVFSASGEVIGYKLRDDWRPFFAELAELFLARTPYAHMVGHFRHYPDGRQVYMSSLQYVIKNPFYRGQSVYGRTTRASENWITATAQHESPWDAATCRAIEQELARRKSVGKGWTREYGNILYLFNGVVHCGICGRILQKTYTPRQGIIYKRYRCGQPWAVLAGHIPGPAHEQNAVSEFKLIKLLDEQLAMLTPADIDDYLRSLSSPTVSAAQVRAGEIEIATLEQEAGELRAGLRTVAGAAAIVLTGELKRVEAEHARACARLDALTKSQEPFDLAERRERLLAFLGCLPLSGLGYDDLRQMIRDNIPVLYVINRKLVGGPVSVTVD